MSLRKRKWKSGALMLALLAVTLTAGASVASAQQPRLTHTSPTRLGDRESAANRLGARADLFRLTNSSARTADGARACSVHRLRAGDLLGSLRLSADDLQRLRPLHNTYARLNGHDVGELSGPRGLSQQEMLETGVAIGAGWKVAIRGRDVVEFRHQSGALIKFRGDPHIHDASDHYYGDWLSNEVCLVLPGDYQDRVVVWLQSTGGDGANAFGYVERLVAFTDTQAVRIQAIYSSDGKPVGHVASDSLPTHAAYAQRIRSASRMFFVAPSDNARGGRLRLADGRYPRLPGKAYAVGDDRAQAPAQDPDVLRLINGQFLFSATATGAPEELRAAETEQRLRQILAGQLSEDDAVRGAAKRLLASIDAEIDAQCKYLAARESVAARAADLLREVQDALKALENLRGEEEELAAAATRLEQLAQRREQLKTDERAAEELRPSTAR